MTDNTPHSFFPAWLGAAIQTYWPVVAAPGFPAWALWRYFGQKKAEKLARKDRLSKEDSEEGQSLRRLEREERSDLLSEQRDERSYLREELENTRKQLREIERDRDIGWTGLRRAAAAWNKCRHDANNNTYKLTLALEAAEKPIPPLRALMEVPDPEVIARGPWPPTSSDTPA